MSKNRNLGNYGSAALIDADTLATPNTAVKRTAEGKVKIVDATDANDAVAFGQLGTAAQRDVMTSLTDAITPNALMPRGAFGFGGNVIPLIGSYDSVDIPNGLYLIGPSNTGRTKPYTFGYLQVISEGSSGIKHILHSVSNPESYVSQYSNTAWSAWTKEYNSFNIVGTVSKSFAGIPTGAVIERGNNANGEYVKYADGTQICWHTSPGGYAPASADNGLVYSTNITWTFPAQFIAPPSTMYSAGEIVYAGGTTSWGKGAGKLGSTNPTLSTDGPIYIFYSQMGNYTYKLRCFAIGRWF